MPSTEKPKYFHNLFTVLDVGFRLHQLREGSGVCEDELLLGAVATAVGPACENLDFTVSQLPGPLEREGAAPRSRWLGELRSVTAARGGRSRRARWWRRPCGKLRSAAGVSL